MEQPHPTFPTRRVALAVIDGLTFSAYYVGAIGIIVLCIRTLPTIHPWLLMGNVSLSALAWLCYCVAASFTLGMRGVDHVSLDKLRAREQRSTKGG